MRLVSFPLRVGIDGIESHAREISRLCTFIVFASPNYAQSMTT